MRQSAISLGSLENVFVVYNHSFKCTDLRSHGRHTPQSSERRGFQCWHQCGGQHSGQIVRRHFVRLGVRCYPTLPYKEITQDITPKMIRVLDLTWQGGWLDSSECDSVPMVDMLQPPGPPRSFQVCFESLSTQSLQSCMHYCCSVKTYTLYPYLTSQIGRKEKQNFPQG